MERLGRGRALLGGAIPFSKTSMPGVPTTPPRGYVPGALDLLTS
jgi:hypothetical protein